MRSYNICFSVTIICFHLLTTLQAQESNRVCLDKRPNLDSPYLDASLVNIFLTCPFVVHLVGTVIAKDKILTTALPFVNINKEAIIINVDTQQSCPQSFSWRGNIFNVTDVLYHRAFLNDKSCHDIAVLIVNDDLTKSGTQITQINWNAINIAGRDANTFKCLSTIDGESGYKLQTVTVLKSENYHCSTIETSIGSVCGPLGSPLIYKNNYMGFLKTCRPNQSNVTIYSTITAYESFLKNIIDGHFLNNSDIVTHDKMKSAFDNCPSFHNSNEVENLKTLIDSSGVCSNIKDELFKELDKFITIGYQKYVNLLNIPQLLVFEDEICQENHTVIETAIENTTVIDNSPELNIQAGPRNMELFFKDDLNLENAQLNPFHPTNEVFIEWQKQNQRNKLGNTNDNEKKNVEKYLCENIDSDSKFTNEKSDNQLDFSNYKFKPQKSELGSILSLAEVEAGNMNKNPNSTGRITNAKVGMLVVKVIPTERGEEK